MSLPYSHGTGWAGIPRYVAQQRAAGRVAQRGTKIDEIVAELADAQPGDYATHLLIVLEVMRTAQDADLELLQVLARPDDPHLIRHRWQPPSTYNGEDDHVRADQWGDA